MSEEQNSSIQTSGGNSQSKGNRENTEDNVLDPNDLDFQKLPPPEFCPRIALEDHQKKAIAKELSPLQRYVHYMFWCNTKFNHFKFDKDQKEQYFPFLSVLTGNMITVFREDRQARSRSKSKETSEVSEQNTNSKNSRQDYKFKIKPIAKFFLKDIEIIGYNDEFYLLIKAVRENRKFNLQYEKDDKKYNLAFAQCIYRDYQINYSVLRDSGFVKVMCYKPELFPESEFPNLSPSQRFQFFYYAKCIEHGTSYNQEVVQYIHSLVLLGMPIVDLSKIPINNQKELQPIFEALSNQDFVCGICCTKPLPNLMKYIKGVFNQTSKMKLLHLVDCGMKTGLKDLVNEINANNLSQICYWNLRNNHFDDKDIDYFLKIIKKTEKDKLIFLDLSNCISKGKEGFMVNLFEHLEKFPSLQQLNISGSPNNNEVKAAFGKLLQSYQSDSRINLIALDLSNIENVESYLEEINNYDIPLVSLKVSCRYINNEASKFLTKFIRNSKTLRTLDVSGEEQKRIKNTINSEYLVNIIKSIAQNKDLKHFNLIMNNIELKDNKWLTIFAAFLSTDLNKWSSLSLDSNNIDEKDLKALNAFLSNFDHLHSLSMNDNFNYKMPGIEDILYETIDSCKSLKKLSIVGSEKNQLGNKINKLISNLLDSEITQIDFSNNNAGIDLSNNKPDGKFYDELIQAIKNKNNNEYPLQRIKIDGNALPSIGKLKDIISIVDESQSIIEFEFPFKDCQSLKDPASQEQINLVNAINRNRTIQRKLPDLPFKTTHEMRVLIRQMMKGMVSNMLEKEPLEHSRVCEEFGLPLPYRKMGYSIGKNDVVIDLPEKYECYHSELLSKVVLENPQYSIFKKDENNKYPGEEEIKAKFDLLTSASDISKSEYDDDDDEENTEDQRSKVSFVQPDDSNNLPKDEDSKSNNTSDESNEKEDGNAKNNEDSSDEKEKNTKIPKNKKDDQKNKKISDNEEELNSSMRKRKPRKSNDLSESDDYEEESKHRRNSNSKSRRHQQKKQNSEDEYNQEDSEEEHQNRNRNSKSQRKSDRLQRSRRGGYDDSDDDEDDSEEQIRKRQRQKRKSNELSRSQANKSSHRHKNYGDEDEEEDREEGNRKQRRNSKSNQRSNRFHKGSNENSDGESYQGEDSDESQNRQKPKRKSDEFRRSNRRSSKPTSDEYDPENQVNEKRKSRQNIKSREPSDEQGESDDDQLTKSRSRSGKKSSIRNKNLTDSDDDQLTKSRSRSGKKSSIRNKNLPDSDDERPPSASRDKSEEKRSVKQLPQEKEESDEMSSSNSQDDQEKIAKNYLAGGGDDDAKNAGDDDIDAIVKNTNYNINIPKAALSKPRKQKVARSRPSPSTSLRNQRNKSNLNS